MSTSMPIESNKDLPKCLNTPTKQAKKARELATLCTGLATIKANAPQFQGPFQGFFSRTVIVTLEDGDQVVIQFRREALDLECFHLARRTLGSVVPEIELLHDKELDDNAIFTYRMTCMPGKMWLDAMRGPDPPNKLVTANKSLGRVLSRGLIQGDTAKVVDDTLRPHLELLLSSSDAQIRQFDDTTRHLLANLDALKVLPLWVTHFDLNEVNMLLDEHCEVSGLIDWELSTPLPFGMAFNRIHTLAGEYSGGEFYMPPEFEQAERGFWDEVWEGVSEGVRGLVEANLEAVQLAVRLATLLDAFEQRDGKLERYNPVVVKALGKHLTYRIPRLRGADPPYA
ncbi:hypothetical protein BKA80DRAFT_285735 [Phyllosticta citrichinensis]